MNEPIDCRLPIFGMCRLQSFVNYYILMTSPLIIILVSLAGVSSIYAFVCDIRLNRKASRLSQWVKQEYPELWAELNVFLRNWNGGQPGLKLLHRRNVISLPYFDQHYEQLKVLERKFFWGLGMGILCIGLLLIGSLYWGWQW